MWADSLLSRHFGKCSFHARVSSVSFMLSATLPESSSTITLDGVVRFPTQKRFLKFIANFLVFCLSTPKLTPLLTV